MPDPMLNPIRSSAVSTRRRYWRRVSNPKAWWPWGLLPLIGLVLLFFYGALRTAPHIQSEVEASARAQLQEGGVEIRQVQANGQSVSVVAVGEPPQAPLVRGLAGFSQCATWLGPLTCPTTVNVELEQPDPVAVPVSPRAHNFVVAIDGEFIRLTGEVPSQKERERIVRLAASGDMEVVDQLRVSGEQATAQYPLASERAVAVVRKLQRGQASWTAGVFDVTGFVATDADAEQVSSLFNAAEDRPRLGRLELQVAEATRQCNEQFDRLLQASAVRFQSGSAQISSGNEELLQSLAELASQCPGQLIVEGHTDSQGDSDSNQALSLGRANAVRDALIAMGVAPRRLQAHGYGESRPVADNSTANGRARNRRIVISVDPSN